MKPTDQQLLEEAYSNINEEAQKFSGEIVDIAVPLEWLQIAYTAHERPETTAVLAKLMSDILHFKGKGGRSNQSRYEYIMKLTKNNTRRAVDGVRTTSPELKPTPLRPGEPTHGW